MAICQLKRHKKYPSDVFLYSVNLVKPRERKKNSLEFKLVLSNLHKRGVSNYMQKEMLNYLLNAYFLAEIKNP